VVGNFFQSGQEQSYVLTIQVPDTRAESHFYVRSPVAKFSSDSAASYNIDAARARITILDSYLKWNDACDRVARIHNANLASAKARGPSHSRLLALENQSLPTHMLQFASFLLVVL
jgi:hypothetical protein